MPDAAFGAVARGARATITAARSGARAARCAAWPRGEAGRPSVRAHSATPMKKCFDGKVGQDQSPSDAVGRGDVPARRFWNDLDVSSLVQVEAFQGNRLFAVAPHS